MFARKTLMRDNNIDIEQGQQSISQSSVSRVVFHTKSFRKYTVLFKEESPIAAKLGDHFILQRQVTVACGSVLNRFPRVIVRAILPFFSAIHSVGAHYISLVL